MSLPQPNAVIEALRASFIGAEQVYMNGSCVMLYRLLKVLYPDAKIYWSTKARHAITKIGGKYYDITGQVKCTKDYKENEDEWSSVSISVAFPQNVLRTKRFTTPVKL